MTIGPDPMTRMDLMSVRLGIDFSPKLPTGQTVGGNVDIEIILAAIHETRESGEQVVSIGRSGRRLGVVLHRESRDVKECDALGRAVIEVHVRELNAAEALVAHNRSYVLFHPEAQVINVLGHTCRLLGDKLAKRGEQDAEAVVLRGDLDAMRAQVHDGVVAAAMAEHELFDLCAGGLAHHLVAEADTKDRHLANELFDTPETLIRLDMSEFMEKHSVSRIIGAPPGYVGYDEAGQLTEKVRRKPHSVILFDEIEKAHPDVMNILLQILDDGRVTDAHGRTVNFENTIIVMTSNAGSNRTETALGFGKSTDTLVKEKAIKALEEVLRPEFLGRVDEIVVFSQLGYDALVKIAALMIDEIKEPLEERGIELSCSSAAYSALAKQAEGKPRGARELRNAVRRSVEDKITDLLVERYDDPPKKIFVGAKNGDVTIKAE